MIAPILGAILTAFIGSAFNYFGVSCMRSAFELSGGAAIGIFFLGLAAVLGGWVVFAMSVMSAKLFIDTLKEIMKGDE